MHRINYSSIILIVLALSLVIGGGFFVYLQFESERSRQEIAELQHEQERLLTEVGAVEEEKQKFEEEIDKLKQEEEQLAQEKEVANRRVYDLARNGYAIKSPQASQSVEATSEVQSLRVTAPREGEQLCRGENYAVRWESTGFREVSISIGHADSPGGSYLEFSYPANVNETGGPGEGVYVWKVGKAGERDGEDLMLPFGDYRFLVGSVESNIFSESSVFSVLDCAGRENLVK